MPTCALIHAVEPAIEPTRAAFQALWPEAETFDLCDFSLPGDLAAAGVLTRAFTDRMRALAEAALAEGADGILYTCSAFGRAITEARVGLGVPALKPEEAMIEAAVTRGGRIAVLATFAPTLVSIDGEIRAMAAERGTALPAVDLHHVPGAQEALAAGDLGRHDDLVVAAAEDLDGADTVLLAQFTMAHIGPRLPERAGQVVMTSPDAAVRKLKGLLGRGAVGGP